MRRLCSPQDDISDVLRAPPGTDLWLCPNGTVARLVTANTESSTVPSPENSTPKDFSAKRKQWKQDVKQWLNNFGLHADLVDEGSWVEVEVWEPFVARLAGEAWRQHDENQSALPLKRILWPAQFCFRRSTPSFHSILQQPSFEDPLEFSDSWPSESISLELKNQLHAKAIYEERQPKDHEMPSPRVDNLEGLESLSRMAQYPDLQTTNLVYPTPPDGATTIGLTAAHLPDTFHEEPSFNASPAVPHDTKGQSDSKVTSNVGIGTGLYDAGDEDDLFGEMNDRDFGSRGITDADFSFFDDPSFEQMGGDSPILQPQDTAQANLETNVSDQMPDDRPDDKDVPATGPSEASDTASAADCGNTRLDEPEMNTLDPIQVNEGMAIDSSPPSSPHPKAQTISPPLSPVEIKKILFSGNREDKHGFDQDGRAQQGHYHPIAFEKKIGDWDQKYGSAGKFSFSSGKAPNSTAESTANSIPTIGLPHRDRTRAGVSKAVSPLTVESRHRSYSVSSDDSGEDVEAMPPEHIPTAVTLPSLKRKRVPSESDTQSVASLGRPLGAPDGTPGFTMENSAFLGNFLSNFSDWTLLGFFSAFQTQQLPVLVRREEQIAVAQLLVDQVTQSSLDHQLGGRIGLFDLEGENLSLRACLEDADFPGSLTRLDLKGWMSLQDEEASVSAPPPKYSVKGSLSKISIPHLRICRGKDHLEALPPAVSFWETFGLGPASGPKDIAAYCIHPHGASQAADAFLDRFSLLYESCNLGSHIRGERSPAFEKGLRSWESEPSSYRSMMHSLQELCEDLGLDLSLPPKGTDNFVIYIINPFPHAAALVDICAAFWHLFQQMVINTDGPKSPVVNEVVLQIIPMEFIISGESMAVPPQTEYLNLALEVYSRCHPVDANANPLNCAAPILLADSVPKAINFRLAPEKASPLQDSQSLHIACSRSADQRWLSVAWADGSGCLQTSTSYCLRYRSGGAPRTTAEVRNEIWTVTKHIMDKFPGPGRWRIVLVISESIDSDEVECRSWTSFLFLFRCSILTVHSMGQFGGAAEQYTIGIY